MDIDGILSQLADNDEAARAAYRAMNVAVTRKPVEYRSRHVATEFVGVSNDGLATYSNVKF